VISSEAFADQMIQASQGGKASGQRGELSQKDVEEWLRLFGGDDRGE
jgi:hypothetical protein